MFSAERADWIDRCDQIADIEKMTLNGRRVSFALGTCLGKNDPGALILIGGSRNFSILTEHYRDEFVGRTFFDFASKEVFAFLKWMTEAASITAKCCKMDSPILGSGMLIGRPRVSLNDRPTVYTGIPIFIDGKPCLLCAIVEISLTEAAHQPNVIAYTNALYDIGVKVRTAAPFVKFLHLEFHSFFSRDVVGRFAGFIPPRCFRVRLNNTFLEVLPPGQLEGSPRCLRRTVSCPGNNFPTVPTKKELALSLCANFKPGDRVRMTGFKNGTWLNGTEAIVISVPVSGKSNNPRIGVLSANPEAPKCVSPHNLIKLEELSREEQKTPRDCHRRRRSSPKETTRLPEADRSTHAFFFDATGAAAGS